MQDLTTVYVSMAKFITETVNSILMSCLVKVSSIFMLRVVKEKKFTL